MICRCPNSPSLLSKVLAGMLLTTALLILITGDEDKVAVSSLALAHHPVMMNSALAHLADVPFLEPPEVAAALILDLIIANGSTPVPTITAKTLMLIPMLDFLVSNPSEDQLKASASLVLCQLPPLAVPPASVSSTTVVELE